MSDELARCEREIAACAAYDGPDLVGALMGWADNVIEKELIIREIRNEREAIIDGARKEN